MVVKRGILVEIPNKMQSYGMNLQLETETGNLVLLSEVGITI